MRWINTLKTNLLLEADSTTNASLLPYQLHGDKIYQLLLWSNGDKSIHWSLFNVTIGRSKQLLALARSASSQRPDVVHSHSSDASTWARGSAVKRCKAGYSRIPRSHCYSTECVSGESNACSRSLSSDTNLTSVERVLQGNDVTVEVGNRDWHSWECRSISHGSIPRQRESYCRSVVILIPSSPSLALLRRSHQPAYKEIWLMRTPHTWWWNVPLVSFLI